MKNKVFFLFAFAFLEVCNPLRFPYTLLKTGRRGAGRCAVGREIFSRHTGELSNCSPSGCAREVMCALGGPLFRGVVGPCGTPRRGQALTKDECTDRERGKANVFSLVCFVVIDLITQHY